MEITIWMTKKGDVYVWGKNGRGELGLGHRNTVSKPTLLPPPKKSPWSWFTRGDFHVFAMTKSGELYTWGCNLFGQLGSPSFGESVSTPTLLSPPDDSPWDQIYCGPFYTIGLTMDGKAYIWGRDTDDQVSGVIGNSAKAETNHEIREELMNLIINFGKMLRYTEKETRELSKHFSTPRLIPIQNGSMWKTFACGEGHVVGMTQNLRIFAWGNNDNWQTGASTREERSIHLLPFPQGHENEIWNRFECGSDFTVGMTENGEIIIWKNLADAKEPRITKVMTGSIHCEKIYCNGSTPIMTVIRSNKTADVTHPVKDELDPNLYKMIQPPGVGHFWKNLIPHKFHMVGVSSSGDLYVWGTGALGLGNTNEALTPQLLHPPPGTSWDTDHERFLKPIFARSSHRFLHEESVAIHLFRKNFAKDVLPFVSLRSPQLVDPQLLNTLSDDAGQRLLYISIGFPIAKDTKYEIFREMEDFVNKHQLVDFGDEMSKYFLEGRRHGDSVMEYFRKLKSNDELTKNLTEVDEIEKGRHLHIQRKNYLTYLKILYETGHRADTTFVVKENVFRAHRFILDLKSTFFRNLLKKGKIPSSAFRNIKISPDTMKILLEFYYLGYVSTQVKRRNADELLRAQERLHLDDKGHETLLFICKDALK